MKFLILIYFFIFIILYETAVKCQKLRRGLRLLNRTTTTTSSTTTTEVPTSSSLQPLKIEANTTEIEKLLENLETFDDIDEPIKNNHTTSMNYDKIYNNFKNNSFKSNPILLNSKDIRSSNQSQKIIQKQIFSTPSATTADEDSTSEIEQSTEIGKKLDENLEDEEIFENSEIAKNKSGTISGMLVTKLLPEILKLNENMKIGSSNDGNNDDGKVIKRIGKRIRDDEGVVQKLVASRRIREQHAEEELESEKKKFSLKNFSRLEDVFDLYNPYRLSEIWKHNDNLKKLSSECNLQMETFLLSLKQGIPWALKMLDASGHYGGSYFWGNPYWMGSRTLCSEISGMEPDLPFHLGFSVIRTNLTLFFDKPGRSQFSGVCLPYICNDLDIKNIVKESIDSRYIDIKNRSAEILRIKSPHSYYYMIHDRTFWLVLMSTVIVVGLLIVGSFLDIMTERTKKGRPFLSSGIQTKFKYDNYTYAVNPPLQITDDKLDASTTSNLTNSPKACSTPETPNSELEDAKTSIWQEVFLSFSVIRNTKQICDSTIGADTIPTIHGLRSISMAWVILGHTCIVAFKYSDNMEYRKVAERELLYQTINNTAFTVDTFFFISGLLVAYLYFRTTAKVNINKLTKTTGFLSHCIEFIGLLAYRFGRLTIPYIFTLGLVELSMKWFYYNSIFDPPADDHVNCPNYWWRNLLYINTLFPVKDMCMLWSWYLADDTQFYILGIILLILAIRHFKFASISVVVLLIASWCTTGYIAYLNNHMPHVDDPLALFDKIYDKPWTRFGPYLIGMTVGWILFKTDCKIHMKKITVATGWILCTICMLSLVYGLHKKQLDSITAATYSSLSHTAWAIGLSWIVIACSTGHGKYANKLLSCKLLIPFSRTTYCAYLIHPIIIRIVVMTRDSPVHLSEFTIAIMFLGQLTASYLLAFAMSLTFEAPIVSLLKIVSPTKRNKIQ